jgi:hypothetical protein
MRDIATIDAELQLVAFSRQARQRGGPLPSIDVADALLDERCELSLGEIADSDSAAVLRIVSP